MLCWTKPCHAGPCQTTLPWPCQAGLSRIVLDHATPCSHGHGEWTFPWPFHGWAMLWLCCTKASYTAVAMLDQAGLDHAIPCYRIPARPNHTIQDNATPCICGHSGPHLTLYSGCAMQDQAMPCQSMPPSRCYTYAGQNHAMPDCASSPFCGHTRRDHTVGHTTACYRGHAEPCWASTMLNRAGLAPCRAGPCQPMLLQPWRAGPFQAGPGHSLRRRVARGRGRAGSAPARGACAVSPQPPAAASAGACAAMSGYGVEERAGPHSPEYRLFFSECPRAPSRPSAPRRGSPQPAGAGAARVSPAGPSLSAPSLCLAEDAAGRYISPFHDIPIYADAGKVRGGPETRRGSASPETSRGPGNRQETRGPETFRRSRSPETSRGRGDLGTRRGSGS